MVPRIAAPGILAHRGQFALNRAHVTRHLTERRVVGETRLKLDDHQRPAKVLAQDVNQPCSAAVLATIVDDLQAWLELCDIVPERSLQVTLQAEGGDHRILDLIAARAVIEVR